MRAVIKFKIGGNWETRIKRMIFATVDGCPY